MKLPALRVRTRTLKQGGLVILGLCVLLGSLAHAQKVEYNHVGKVDPFLSLLRPEKAKEVVTIPPPPPLDQRPPGLAGLLISEVTVNGVANSGDRQLVILTGVDNMTYFAQQGSKLFDGYLDKSSGDQVVFIREQVDTKGERHVSRVVKRMQTEDR